MRMVACLQPLDIRSGIADGADVNKEVKSGGGGGRGSGGAGKLTFSPTHPADGLGFF